MPDTREKRLSNLSLGLLQAAPDPIIITDANGAIIAANAQTELVFGYTTEDLLGKPVEILLPERFRARHIAHRTRFAAAPIARPMGLGRTLIAQRKDGSEFNVEVSLSPVETEKGKLVISILRDVTVRSLREQELEYLSTHDVVTGCYNRTFFETERQRLSRGRNFPLSVIMIDLDGLKPLNDQRGHAAGDRALWHLAEVLRASLRADEIVARIGGDEFAVLLPNVDEVTLTRTMERIRAAASAYRRRWTDQCLDFSMGGATAARREDSIEEAIRLADTSMYAQKRARKQDASTKDLQVVLDLP